MAASKSFSVVIDIIAKNSAAAGLSAVAKQILGLNVSTSQLTGNMNRLKLAVGGVAAIAGGAMILRGAGALLKSGEGYLEQITQARNMGLSTLEIAKLELAARETSAKVVTSTYQQNLRAGRELLMVFNKQEDAFKYLPKLQAMASNIMVGSNAAGKPIDMDKATDMTYEAARALDLLNVTQDSAKTIRMLDGMQKAATAFGYKITPQDFYAATKYMKGVQPGENFMTQRLPTMISDLNASTAGVVVNQLNRTLVAGRADHKSAEALQSLGLVSADGIVYNKAGQIKGIKAGGVVGSSLAQTDQYAWFQQYFLPAMAKKGGFSVDALKNTNDPQHAQALLKATTILNETFGGNRNQLQGATMYATQQSKFERDLLNMQRVKGIDGQMIQNMRGSPALAKAGVSAQWSNVKTALGMALAPAATELLINFAVGLNKIAEAIQAHPTATKVLVWLGVGIGALLVVLGGVALIAAGVTAVMGILGGGAIAVIVGVIAAIGVGIAMIYSINWGAAVASIKGFVNGVTTWVGGAWGSMVEGLTKFMSNIITWFKTLPARMWEGVKNGAKSYGEAIASQHPESGNLAPPPPPPGHGRGSGPQKVSFSGPVMLNGRQVGYAMSEGMPTGGSSTDTRYGNPFVTA